MKKHNHMLNRIYLLSSLVLSILVPWIALPVYKQEVVIQGAKNNALTQSISGQAEMISDQALQWVDLLQVLYLMGVVISFAFIARGLIKIISMIRNGKSVIINGVKVIYVNDEVPLCSFGGHILAPIHKKDKLTAYELTHEINHISKFHTLDILFIKILRAFYWFNPVMYFYEKRLFEVHEYQADEATYNALGKESYLNFLVDQLSKKRQPILAHNFNSLIKKRLIMMSSESKSGHFQYLAILPILLVVMSLFSFESYNSYVDTDGNDILMLTDTIPDGAIIDSILLYDFDLKKGIKHTLIRPKGGNAYLLPSDDPKVMNWTDTISTIDYDTYVETIVTINLKTGVIDTLHN